LIGPFATAYGRRPRQTTATVRGDDQLASTKAKCDHVDNLGMAE
jgi:hypothetical protein